MMLRSLSSIAAVLLFVLVAGCGGDDGPGTRRDSGGDDSGPPGDGGGECAEAAECDDGSYCNGEELCTAGRCVAGEAIDCDDGVACTVDACSDEMLACRHVAPDEDGDGHAAATCVDADGMPIGDDCDDSDAAAFPGNAETCDGHDEDCNPETLGFIDGDGDGSASSACCNGVNCGPDCNDADSSVRPGVADGPLMNCDTIDNDCDGGPDEGCPCVDGETMVCGIEPELMMIGLCRPGMRFCVGGVFTEMCSGGVHPQEEICDTLDNDCDGTADEFVERRYYRDGDGDGFGVMSESVEECSAPMGYSATPTDCDDTMRGVNPGAPEVCNGVDDDCDGMTDEGLRTTFYRDMDGDGFGAMAMTMEACSRPTGYAAIATDCDDTLAAVHPGAADACNGIDDDCNGTPDPGCSCTDGMTRPCGSSATGACRMGTQRCLGGAWGACSGNVEPVTESCNGADDDCDGMVDDGVRTTYYRDSDRDGFGDMTMTMAACTLPAGYSTLSTDCADMDGARHPGAFEACNGIDDDCSGTADTGCTCTDGMTRSCGMTMTGLCELGTQQCVGGIWGTCVGEVRPGTESCNGLDDDCDGMTDEMTTVGCYTDGDSDGTGAGALVQRCPDPSRTMFGMCPAGYSNVAGDCNDANGSIRPGGTESCNGTDDDCDSMIDDGVTNVYYRDADRDGYGATAMTMSACMAPAGFVAASGDCNDASAAVHPGATEVCDGTIDHDCAGGVDDGCACTDGTTRSCGMTMTGACELGVQQCIGGTWGACIGEVRPGTETCNAVDDDCDGTTDEMLTVTCYADGDSDNFGAGAASQRCPDASRPMSGNCPAGFTSTNTDCNDGNALTRPGGTEVCNGTDDDCDGMTDELVMNTYYRDADSDGYGHPTMTMTGCVAPPGYVPVGGDCNDASGSVRPGAAENCNGIDENCSMGVADEPTRTFYQDADSDLYGNTAVTMSACVAPPGYVDTSGDCNDGNAAVRPGATERCNTFDDDCDGTTNESPATTLCAAENPAALNVTAWTCGGPGMACLPTCAAGFSDCANGAFDGCEANLQTSTSTCGSCGNACGFGALCRAGVCDTIGDLIAGSNNSCVRWQSGPPTTGRTLVCWGAGSGGQVGPTLDDATVPVAIEDMLRVNWATIGRNSFGEAHLCANNGDFPGALYCWGHNTQGQVGNGSTASPQPTPELILGMNGGDSAGLGFDHTCWAQGGSVRCWGDNDDGEIGADPAVITGRTTPGTGFGSLYGLSAGGGTVPTGLPSSLTCGRTGTGGVQCFGSGQYGRLGRDSAPPFSDSFTPVNVCNVGTCASLLSTVTDVQVGGSHVCALRSGGTITCWGVGSQGQIGDGSVLHVDCDTVSAGHQDCAPLPVSIAPPAGTTWVQVATGLFHTCGRTSTNRIYCWGANAYGQLGLGDTTQRNAPVLVPSLMNVADVAAGTYHTCASLTNGDVYCWGRNEYGQLGRGSISSPVTPNSTPALVVGF